MKIGLIGSGRMGRSLIKGWVKHFFPADVCVAVHGNTQEDLEHLFGVRVAPLDAFANDCDVLVVGVKPPVVPIVCQRIKLVCCGTKKPIVLSVAAGISSTALQHHLGHTFKVARAMPNIASQVQSSMTTLFGADLKEDEKRMTESTMACVGQCLWLKNEHLMHAATAICGSGPAYFLLMAEAMTSTAVQLGFAVEEAKQLVSQTLLGTAMVLDEHRDPKTLRQSVVSKGGTTQSALSVLMSGGFEKLCVEAVQSACARSIEMEQLVQ